MKFGYLENVDNVDFSLPKDPCFTTDYLKDLPPAKATILIGCSVWSEKSYVGHIYPPGTKQQDYLTEYAKQFNSIEVNATRYGVPKPSILDKWKNSTPSDFRFCFKVPQIISFSKDLNSIGSRERMDGFIEAAYGFGEKMGPSFIVLPKHFGNHRYDDLKTFVGSLPLDMPLSFEFRNNEIIKNQEVWELLKKHNKPLVITDTPGERDFVHQVITNDTVFIRFVGAKLHKSDYTRIDEWVERLISWVDAGVTNIGFFLHQAAPFKYLSADLAIYMIEKLNNKKPELQLKAPVQYALKLDL